MRVEDFEPHGMKAMHEPEVQLDRPAYESTFLTALHGGLCSPV